jgi:hypothetical protein
MTDEHRREENAHQCGRSGQFRVGQMHGSEEDARPHDDARGTRQMGVGRDQVTNDHALNENLLNESPHGIEKHQWDHVCVEPQGAAAVRDGRHRRDRADGQDRGDPRGGSQAIEREPPISKGSFVSSNPPPDIERPSDDRREDERSLGRDQIYRHRMENACP